MYVTVGILCVVSQQSNASWKHGYQLLLITLFSLCVSTAWWLTWLTIMCLRYRVQAHKSLWAQQATIIHLVLRFADISHPLNSIAKEDIPFEWTKARHDDFNLLKRFLTESQVLNYSDLRKQYSLFTMQVDMLMHVIWHRRTHTIWIVVRRQFYILSHMWVVCLKAVNLHGLPSLRRHMLFTGLLKICHFILKMLISL